MPSINLGRVRGDKGTSMRNRGEWNSALKYVNDKDYIDLVSHNGSLWTCIATNTNVEPSNDALEWNLTAKSIDTVYFEQAQRRENIASGESAETVFGKIARWFSDFKDAAFYNVVNGVSQTKAGEAVLDAAVGKYLDEKKLDISKVIASRAITEYGFVMDGKTVADWLSELNSKLGVISAQAHVTLTTGVTLERYGKNRILHFLNATSDEGGLITTLQGLDWPPFTCHAPIAIRGSSTANLYVSIDLNGNVIIWNNGKRQKATAAIIGAISWCVD